MTTYRDSGVDIDAQDRALAQIKKMVRKTYTDDVLSDQGAFGGLFRMPVKGLKEPVLVASADGVGTKLAVAFATGRHGSVGRDLVHHCINDILYICKLCSAESNRKLILFSRTIQFPKIEELDDFLVELLFVHSFHLPFLFYLSRLHTYPSFAG